MDVEEGELPSTGARWIVMGDKVIVDPKHMEEYRKSVRRTIRSLRPWKIPVERSIALVGLAYVTTYFGVVVHS